MIHWLPAPMWRIIDWREVRARLNDISILFIVFFGASVTIMLTVNAVAKMRGF